MQAFSEKQGNLMLVLPNKILRPHKLGIAYQTLQVLESSFLCNRRSNHAQTATGLMVMVGGTAIKIHAKLGHAVKSLPKASANCYNAT